MLPLPALATRAVGILRREWDLRHDRPQTVVFNMTYKCNLSCVTCGVWVRGETDTGTELTTDELLSSARQLRDLGIHTAVLVGSEPLLRRDALEVIEALRAMDLAVILITNGTLVTDRVAERLVRAGVAAVAVSIDGVGERHNTIRNQPLAYERAMAGVRRLKDARERLGSETPALELHATISLHNTDVLDEISGLSEELGLPVDFQLASETLPGEVEATRMDGTVIAGTELVAREGSFLLDGEGVRRLRAFAARPGITVKHPALRLLSLMSDEDLLAGRFPVKRCSVLAAELQIDPYGEVMPCSHLGAYSYGNVRESTLAEIWNGARRRRLLDEVGDRGLFPVCAKCCQHANNITLGQKARMMLNAQAGKTAL